MLELKHITKDYIVGSDTVHALKGVDLAFGESGMVSILGQSGCGKTTLLNIIGGLDRYTDGDLIINGRSTKYFVPSDWDAYRNQNIGFVFQSYNLIPHLTVLGNVELALTLSGISKAERRRRAEEALCRVGLAGELKKRPNQMSGGQMQRVAIARAIVNDPDIILADEPTGALDSSTSVDVMEILKEISKDRLVIMVTHNGALAEQYSTRIISMLDGSVVGDTAPVEFVTPDEEKTDTETDAVTAEEKKKRLREHKKEQKAISKANRAALKRTSMSFFTAFALSWRNLITKKGRTIATAVAGSIGIIGVALVLALSNGFNAYIVDMQTSMLAHYPVTATQFTVDMEGTMQNMQNMPVKIEDFPDGNKLVVKEDASSMTYHFNRITKDYLDHVAKMPANLAIDVTYDYAKTRIVMSKYTANGGYGTINTTASSMSAMTGMNSSNFKRLLNNTDYVLSQYDVLQGKYPTAANEVAVIVGSDNSLNVQTFQNCGLKVPDDKENATFDDLIGQELKLIFNDQWFAYDDAKGYYVSFDKTNPTQAQWQALYENENNLTLKVVGVMRIKEDAALALFGSGVAYTPALTDLYLQNCKNSEVAKAQAANLDESVSDALPDLLANALGEKVGEVVSNVRQFNHLSTLLTSIANRLGMSAITVADVREMAMQAVGASDMPNALNFYPVTFSAKTDMINYLNTFNDGKDLSGSVYTLDASSVVTGSVSDMIDIISYVLIAFAAISLLVSSVMISIITYASVVERTKEIGVLRSVGARKTDIMRVFNAETVIIGLAAGIIGVLVTLILSFPLSALFISISEGMVATSLVSVAWWHAVLLILISVLLTTIAGMLPALSASKKDPVVALRSE